MALWKYTQRTFNGGVLDRELMGRQDLSKYFCGASRLKNFLVRRQGNLAKRRGTDFVANITNILGHSVDWSGTTETGVVQKTRTVPIVYERESGFYALLCGKRAFLVSSKGVYCRDGAWRRSISDYLAVRSNGACKLSDGPVAFIENVPYDTLAHALNACRPGQTVILCRDAVLGSASRCYGTLDLNGYGITMTSNKARIIFGKRGFTSGIIDSTHSFQRIYWSTSVTTFTDNLKLFTHSEGNMVIDGVCISFPFTGSGACILYSPTAKGTVLVKNCMWEARCGYGLIYSGGIDSSGATDITIYESDLSSMNANYTTFYVASGSDYNRKIHFKTGSIHAAGSVSNYGLRLEGGVVTCASFGTAIGTSTGYNKVSAGLVYVQLAADEILSGSEYKGTTVYNKVTFYNYNLTSEGAYRDTRNPEGHTQPQILTDTSPYSCEIQIEDGDLAEVDTFQSGDTIFLAHKYYAPSKLTFDYNAMSLEHEMLEFNATTWKRPVVTVGSNTINVAKSELSVSGTNYYKTNTTYSSVTSSDATCTKTTKCSVQSSGTWTVAASTTSSLPVRTVKYCITYVKDGVESAPSNPVSVSYGAPWEEGGTVKLNLSKGSNEEEPDYYNIYKKESTEFGLIGSTTKPCAVDVYPEISGEGDGGTACDAEGYACSTFNGKELKCSDPVDILNTQEDNALTDAPSKVVGTLGEYEVYRGVGGVSFGSYASAAFDFGENSGISINQINLCLDSHTIMYVEHAASGKVKVYDQMMLSGKRINATVYYTPKTGTQTVSTQTVAVSLDPVTYTPEGGTQQTDYWGTVRHYCGTVDPGAPFSEVSALVNRSVRTGTATFSALADGTNQVRKIVLQGVYDDDDGVECVCDCYLNGIEFVNNETRESTFEDDYITPDLTVTPPSGEAQFRGRGNYPSSVGMYQQRLIFAATEDQPFGFWMSAVGDLYNFSPHSSIREDDAISAELAATEFPNINHIVMNRDIIMLGDGGEWKIAPVTGNTITYKTISAELESSIGSAKWLKPITVGEEVIFAERTGMTLRSIVYNYASDGYESTDLSVLSGDLFANNRIERMCYKQHPDSTIECVLSDGTVATMVYMPEHEVAAWSLCTLGGGYIATDIATSKALNGNTTDVLLTVNKGATFELWTVRPDLPEVTVDAQTCMDRVQSLTATEASSGWVTGWTAVDRATGVVVTATSGLVSGHTYLCGFVFDAEYVSVRPEPAGNETIQFEIKNARSAEVRMLNAGDFTVRGYDVDTTRTTGVTTGFSMAGGANVEKDYDVILSGKNTKDGRITIKSSTPNPCSILSVSVVYQIEQRDLNSKE